MSELAIVHQELQAFPQTPTVQDIHHLSDLVRKCPPNHCPTSMCFANGMAARTMFMEANNLVIGRMHKHEHLLVLLYGDITISGVDGTTRMRSGDMIKSKPFAKRVIRSHADSMMLTVHRAVSTDEAGLFEELLVPEDEEAMHEVISGDKP